jgi:hypothetical protein
LDPDQGRSFFSKRKDDFQVLAAQGTLAAQAITAFRSWDALPVDAKWLTDQLFSLRGTRPQICPGFPFPWLFSGNVLVALHRWVIFEGL